MERDGRKISRNDEKKFLSFYLTATNTGGHSSRPVKKNAIYDLSRALFAVQDYDFPVRLNEVTETFFAGSAGLVGGEVGEAMRRIVADPDDVSAAATLLRTQATTRGCAPPASPPCSRAGTPRTRCHKRHGRT